MRNARSKVLIVDDDPVTTDTFARMLRLEGHDVRTAPDAQTALVVARAFAPDAIIVDFRMPLIDGLEFIIRLRAEEPDSVTPIAIVTGDYFLDEHVATELEKLGILLRFKPLWLDDLCTLAGMLLAAPEHHGKSTPGTRDPGVRGEPSVVTVHSHKAVR
jgi:two-component system OmpR family response regulator